MKEKKEFSERKQSWLVFKR